MQYIGAIVIPYYNNVDFLREVLDALKKQTVPIKAIIVDNSGNGEMISKLYNFTIYHKMPFNSGFALAVNKGIHIAYNLNMEYIGLLNDDAVPLDDWFEKGVNVLAKDKDIWVVTGKIILYNKRNKLNSTGVIMNKDAYAFDRDFGKNIAEVFPDEFVLAPSGAAMIMKKDVINRIGTFDNSLFAYFEDTDIGMRIWNANGKVKYVNNMIAYHRFSASASSNWKDMMMSVNRLYIIAKHFSFFRYIKELFRELAKAFKDRRYFKHFRNILLSIVMFPEAILKKSKNRLWEKYLLPQIGVPVFPDIFNEYATVLNTLPTEEIEEIIVGYNDNIIGLGWSKSIPLETGGFLRYIEKDKAMLFSSLQKGCFIFYLSDDAKGLLKIGNNVIQEFEGNEYMFVHFNIDDKMGMREFIIEKIRGKIGFVSLEKEG